jgi:hypothetical protein
MALMEFLKENKLNTTTQVVVPALNTGTIAFAFDRNTKLPFTSSGYNSDTSLAYSIEFATPTVLSHVLIQNHNLKNFRVFYNSLTANSLGIVSGNSATSTYLSFSSVTVSSITLQMDQAMSSVDKSFGELVVTERIVQFERNPSARDFDPVSMRKKVVHDMPDGGRIQYIIRDKFKATLKWKFISETFKTQLQSLYEDAVPFYFVPFPTTTTWDGRAYDVLWDNDFDFAHDDNSKTAGFGGSIKLWETPNA